LNSSTKPSENRTQAVRGGNARITFHLFTLDNFQSQLEYTKFLAVITLVIGGLGLIGNISTILKIWRDKKFHTPTFTVIACLAFADFISIIRCYFIYFTNLQQTQSFYETIVFVVLFTACDMSYNSSLGHMMLLSVVRYLITVHPLQSRSHLTTSVVLLWSLTVWVLSLMFSAFRTVSLAVVFHYVGSEIFTSEASIWVLNLVRIIQTLTPFCTILSLHCLKMKYLKSSQVKTETKKRMNLIITNILAVFFIFQTFIIVFFASKFLIYYGNLGTSVVVHKFNMHWHNGIILISFVHFSCNPYIYFLISFCLREKWRKRRLINFFLS
jgi:hypothetical protein